MTKATIVIASAFRANLTAAENAHRSIIANNYMKQMLESGHNIQHALGSWKEEGQEVASTELSLIGVVPETNLDNVLYFFLQKMEQDAVLTVNPETMAAYILSKNGNVVESNHIGTMQEITEEEAKASECYTYWKGVYWLAK